MLRVRLRRATRPESTTLTAWERRRFRQVWRGLRATDPHWFALHCPRRQRRSRVAWHAAAALSLLSVLAGALTGTMPAVLTGVLLAFAVATGHVSTGARRRARR